MRLCTVLLLLLLSSCQRSRPAPERPVRYVGGVQVNEPDHLVWGTKLRALGLNTVAVTVYAKQGDWDTANLWYEEEEPAVVSEMRIAKTLGLKVVLILRVALDHAFERNRFLWHGMILPTREDALTEWFERYGAFTAKWAAIARREGVDVLGIASEMSALTNTEPLVELPDLEAYYLDETKQAAYRRIIGEANLTPRQLAAAGAGDFVDPIAFVRARAERWTAWAGIVGRQDDPDPLASINARRSRLETEWRKLIARVRQHYRGPLTYAANFDQYNTVGFWDALDVVGVNAYFPLRDRLEHEGGRKLKEELTAGWTGVLGGLQDFPAGGGPGESARPVHRARLHSKGRRDGGPVGHGRLRGPPSRGHGIAWWCGPTDRRTTRSARWRCRRWRT